MWDLVAIGSVILFLSIMHWLKTRMKRMQMLLNAGIPGPKPNFWIGNLKDCFSMGNVQYDSHLVKTYGEISGYYLGAKPIILIADPDLLKIIEVQESRCFRNRPRRVPGGINPDPKRKEMLGNLPADEWEKTRKILSPAFTPHKLRLMIPQIDSKIMVFMRKIQEQLMKTPVEVDFYKLFQALTLDIIGQTGFGCNCNIQENIQDPLHKAVQAEFSKSPNSTLVKIYLCFPELAWIIQPIRIFYQRFLEKLGWSESCELWEQGFNAFKQRLNGPQRPDLLQQLINSDLRDCPLRIVANTVLFFEAAYETLSSSLGFTVHLLVNHPEIQEKVRREILDVLKTGDGLSFDNLKKFEKLDQAIKESLRMYPPQTTFIGRAGDRDLNYEKDGRKYTIPRGVHVQVALYQIQNSEKYWKNPHIFDPERFSPKRCDSKEYDYTWHAFGKGARECIGKSFANIVLKMVLANILSKYELKPSPSTEETVTLNYKVATMTPKFGSYALPVPLN